MSFTIQLQPRAVRPSAAEAYAVEALRARLDEYGRHLRGVRLRFDEVSHGPGDIDKICRVHVTLAGVRDVPGFVVEGRAPHEREAADLAVDAVHGAVRRAIEEGLGRRQMRKLAASRRKRKVPILEVTRAAGEELVEEAEPRARGSTTPRALKTARPPRGRGLHKTQREARATASREVSATQPSRKSTRKSANRSKRDSNQLLRTRRAVRSPGARAERGH
jgi:hypothetical protein